MASTGPTKSISDQAVEWAVEAAHGDMTRDSRDELEAWLAMDQRHRGAFVRASAWLRVTEEAVIEAYSSPPIAASMSSSPVSDNDNVQEHGHAMLGIAWPGLFRWAGKAVAGAAAFAAFAAILAVAGVPLLSSFGPTDLAASEEIVKLKDGSVVTLGPNARIQATLSNDIRGITLLNGAATFKVAKDRNRPFVVRAGDIFAQATGTVYSVSRVGLTGGTVKVSEGSVLVWPHDERDQAILLHQGGMVTLDPGPSLSSRSNTSDAVAPRSPPPQLAQISLDNVPVQSAVARFNRVNDTKIVIADPAIGEIKIIGLYRANDPERFAEAVAAISGGVVINRSDEIVIKMK